MAPVDRRLVAALVIGAALGMADATIVAVALDPISRRFAVPLAAAQATLVVYLVTVTALLPLLGRAADAVGRRRAYLAGFAIFAAASALAAVAPTFGVLLAARAAQAVGGGLLTSGSLALVAQHIPRRRTGRAVAVLVVAQAVAGLLAPPVGGLLVSAGGWRAVFWAGVPVAAAGALLAMRTVPHTASVAVERLRVSDLGGAAVLGLLLLGAGATLESVGVRPLLGAPAWLWPALALAGAAGLVPAARGRRPPVDTRLLHGRFGAASVATMLSTGSLMTCFALLPFWLEDAHGASAALAGLAFLPVGAGIAATSRHGGRLGDRGATRRVTAVGMSIAAAGLVVAALAAVTDAWWLLALGLLVLGGGNGLFSSPNTAAAMRVAPRSLLGTAAGLLSTARSVGVVVGLGAAGAAYTVATQGGGAARADHAAAAIFAVAAGICAAVAVISHRVYRTA